MTSVSNNDNIYVKPRLGAWIGMDPSDPTPEKPSRAPFITWKPWHFTDFIAPLYDRATYVVRREIIKLITAQPPNQEAVAGKVLDNFEANAGVSPDYLMHYMQWYDGWDYVPFPDKVGDFCASRGKTLVITWMPYFKRRPQDMLTFDKNGRLQMSTYLDEFNKQIRDRKSELYRYVVEFARDAKHYTQSHHDSKGNDVVLYLRPFHEMNLGFAYWWTMFMNGGAGAPEKFVSAWRALHDIMEKEAGPNVRLIWCPEAKSQCPGLPTREDMPSWARFEAYYPGDKYVDMIGFDMYQKDATETFKKLFYGVNDEERRLPENKFYQSINGFLRRHASVPRSICEASTYPEFYRVDFVNRLFETAEKNNFVFVTWFNEYKKEGKVWRDWRFDAKIAAPEMASDDLWGAPTNTPRVLLRNDALRAFRQALRDHTSSRSKPVTVNPKEANIDSRVDVELFAREYGFRSTDEVVWQSNALALALWRTQTDRNKASARIGRAEVLDRFGAVDINDPASRLSIARNYVKMWQLKPDKHSSREGSIFQEARLLLERNIPGDFLRTSDPQEFTRLYYAREHISSLIELQDLLVRYYDIFMNDTKENIQLPDLTKAAFTATLTALSLLGDDKYMRMANVSNGIDLIFDRNWVLGNQAQVLVSLGDICMGAGVSVTREQVADFMRAGLLSQDEMETYVRMCKLDSGNNTAYARYYLADRFYAIAQKKLEEKKGKWDQQKELFLTFAAKMGRARVAGLSVRSVSERRILDNAVREVAMIVKEDRNVDPGLLIKAKFCLGQLMAHYLTLEGISNAEKAKMLTAAYMIYEEIVNTAYGERAREQMSNLESYGKSSGGKNQ